ncbi:MAG: hypothetical protein NZ585_11885 [Chloracidobacterium sp.]|nr:hypothetical protein [Chloracidobacterium sp.]MDW8218230.1 hypothetical protein [Acidobacteriota bacterium]
MTIADVLAVVCSALLLGGSLVALTTLLALLLPSLVSDAAAALSAAPKRVILLGGVIVTAGLCCAAVFANALPKLGALLALVIVLSLMSLAALGGAGLAQRVADKLHPGQNDWRRQARAALLIIGAALAPLVGWLVVLPLLVGAMVGSGVCAVWRVGRRRALQQPTTAYAPPLQPVAYE